MVPIERSEEVCSITGGGNVAQIVITNSLQARLAALYPTLVHMEKQGPQTTHRAVNARPVANSRSK